ncbi:MAG TPA: hypothetical protein VG276_28985 [Actinomycetes bacterium]|nr:hypothetical protein [Actinomycetes bacterium]
MSERVPPIPMGLAHRPTTGGLVIPWVNVALADGGADFRSVHHSRWVRCWTQGICQSCGEALGSPVVMLGGPNQLAGYFDEPPLHPWCASYATRACPMVAGRMPRYADRQHVSEGVRGRSCPEPGCDCAGWVPHTRGSAGGEPAHEWWAVWCRSWSIAVTPERRLLGGVPADEVRRYLVSTPA